MTLQVQQTSDFQVQFETTEFSQTEIPVVQQRAQALVDACEADLSTLSGWFGISSGQGLGPSNRVFVTLTKTVRGADNTGYSTSNPRMRVNPQLGAADAEVFLGFFVAELIEILMSYTDLWGPRNSGGEGLSRVAAELLHPGFAPHTPQQSNVNAWLASDPTGDPSSAVADSQFRKDWVSENFTGGPLKAGGFVNGDDDSYSYGCAILFIYYLKDQLGFSMSQIVQNGAATLDDTYRQLTNGRTDAFWRFKSLLDRHFPIGTLLSADDPFPLSQISLSTEVSPGAAGSGNTAASLITSADDRVFYTWWDLGQGGNGFAELDGGFRTDVGPAAALVGAQHDYLFVVAKDLDGNLFLNQGQLGQAFVGWQDMGFQSKVAAGAAASGETTAVVAVDLRGVVSYSYWDLGQGGTSFAELDGGFRTDVGPAAALVGAQHDYLFVVAKDLDGNLFLNQGQLGQAFVGWQPVSFD